jgi:hypothetical protein
MVRVACWTLAIAIIIALIAMVIAFRQNPNAFGVMTEEQRIEQGIEPVQYPAWR